MGEEFRVGLGSGMALKVSKSPKGQLLSQWRGGGWMSRGTAHWAEIVTADISGPPSHVSIF